MNKNLTTASSIQRTNLPRRVFVATMGCAGLSLGFPTREVHAATPVSGDSFSAYLHIFPDNRVRILVPGAELGQGVFTSLPKILAEELEADFDTVEIELAPGDDVFANPAKGRQSTGFSDAIRGYAPVLRHVGAAAKEMLIAAAAARWEIDPSQCRAENSHVLHDPSGRKVTFGEVAADAATFPLPSNPILKSREQFKLIGRPSLRKDTPAKVDGSVQYGADIKLPGLLYATVRACPVFGGLVASFDEDQATKFEGVFKCVRLTDRDGNFNAIGVIATSFWQAKKAADSLEIDWDTQEIETIDSVRLAQRMTDMLDDDQSAKVMAFANGKIGDAAAAFDAAERQYSAVYEVPYLAHVCMEPMAATCVVNPDSVELWAPSQQQSYSRQVAADVTGMPLRAVTMHTTFAGGGFGRKWEIDFTRQAVELAAAVAGSPVRMVWTREEDIQHDYYRPGYAVRVRTGFESGGKLNALSVRLAGQSLLAYQRRSPKPPMPDATVVVGAINPIYSVPNTLIDYVEIDLPIQIGFWRSVGWSHNGFISESSIDEAAVWAGRDPIAFRRDLIHGKARETAVLDTIEKLSGWGRQLPSGHGMGIALTAGFEAVTAQVAHVSVIDGQLRVHKVWCVYDAGMVVDPLNVEAQVESGIVYGLSAALFGEITFEKGAVVQSNFDDFGMLTLANMPDLEVHVMETGDEPGGAGEASVPGIAPAVTNAIFAATGERIRKLPLRSAGLNVA